VEAAVDLSEEAIDEDNNGNYQVAIEKYENAITLFAAALRSKKIPGIF
jgi:hypothetical protein